MSDLDETMLCPVCGKLFCPSEGKCPCQEEQLDLLSEEEMVSENEMMLRLFGGVKRRTRKQFLEGFFDEV